MANTATNPKAQPRSEWATRLYLRVHPSVPCRLRVSAAYHGVSMEERAEQILDAAFDREEIARPPAMPSHPLHSN